MTPGPFPKTSQNTVNRHKERAQYDRDTIRDIIAECKIAHVSWADDTGTPNSVPMIAALEESDDDWFLIFHGYVSSRFIKSLSEPGTRIVAAFTILDGYKLALSHFNLSMAYRSAILHGYSMPIGALQDEAGHEHQIISEKFKLVVEATIPGRWDHGRLPSDAEVKGTGLIRMVVESASAKVSSGPPIDDQHDRENLDLVNRTWTGFVPVTSKTLEPQPTPYCTIDVPDHVRDLR